MYKERKLKNKVNIDYQKVANASGRTGFEGSPAH